MKMRTIRTKTLSTLAGLGMAALCTLAASAQGPQPQPPKPPAPAPAPHCTILGVPACAEAGTSVRFTITVRDENNNPRRSAEVREGTSISGTTGNDGKHDMAVSCGAAGSRVEINVYVGGRLCGTKTITCYKKDKDGRWIIEAAQLASVGSQALSTDNLLAAATDLTFDGTTFAGPNVADMAISMDVSKTSGGSFQGEITDFSMTYDEFSAAGYKFGSTQVKLKDNDANYLSIDPESGEVSGFLQTLIYNEVVDGLERHLHLTGSYDGGLLELDVAGFLIETGPSPAVQDADKAPAVKRGELKQ